MKNERIVALGIGLSLGALLYALDAALAQSRHPFAVGGQEAAGVATGFGAMILSWQNKFNMELQAAARALKTDSAAFFTLGAASFAYGAFHAAGPGHGKAVLTSYMLANETALTRGLLLASLAALLQGCVAIALVSVMALIFNATATRMNDAAHIIELASFAAIAALGARLVWTKGRAFMTVWRMPASIASHSGFVCEAIDDPAHLHDTGCRHLHAPDPSALTGARFQWADALMTVVAAGFRPCSGAILVLVFTLSQGVFAAGIVAVMLMSAGVAITTGALAMTAVYAKTTAQRLGGVGSRRALLIGRGAELVAAILVLTFGLALLAGLNGGLDDRAGPELHTKNT